MLNDEGLKNFISNNNLIHLRYQQRNSKKGITILEGLTSFFDETELNKILKKIKKKNSCNGSINKENQIINIQLQGDHRKDLYNFLLKFDHINKENIKIHGF